MVKRLLRLATISLCLTSVFSASAGNADNVRKTVLPAYNETVYSVSAASCEIRWTVKRFRETAGFGISERSQCFLPLAEQADYRSDLLKAVMADTNHLEGMRNFSWGRLQRGDANDEYGVRLAQAAAASKHWSASKGAVVRYPEGVNRFVIELLNRHRIFSELAASFDALGLELTVNGVEEVRTGELPGAGAPGGKYPIDCAVTFAISKKTDAPR